MWRVVQVVLATELADRRVAEEKGKGDEAGQDDREQGHVRSASTTDGSPDEDPQSDDADQGPVEPASRCRDKDQAVGAFTESDSRKHSAPERRPDASRENHDAATPTKGPTMSPMTRNTVSLVGEPRSVDISW